MLNVVFTVLLVFSYISAYIPPDWFWMPALIGMAYPYLLFINFLFLVFWIFFRPKFMLVSALAIVLGWGALGRYVQFISKKSETPDFTVISYNVKHFTGNETLSTKKNADSIITFLKKNEPDIVCLQEVRLRTNSVFNLQRIINEFPSIDHYQYARTSPNGGSVTLTRFPILKMGEVRFENSGNIAIFTDILIGKDTARVYNVHLQSYRIDPKRYSIIESPGITEEKDLQEVKEIGKKFRQAFKMRAQQARVVRKSINSSPYPVIVCGDFNDTPMSYAYRKVRGRLKDAFCESGAGIGETYIGKLPSFRIDYILHSKFFDSYNFRPAEIRFSDHLPIVCGMSKRR